MIKRPQGLNAHPRYKQIIQYIRDTVDSITYSELIVMIGVKFGHTINNQEVLIYHMKKNDIIKKPIGKLKVRNIKGLKKIYKDNLFKLEDIQSDE